MPSYVSTQAYPAALDPLTPKVLEDGGDFGGILQPEHQATHVSTLPATVTTATAVGTLVVGSINEIIAALVAVGIMKAS